MYKEHKVTTLSSLGCELKVQRLVDVQGGGESIIGECAGHFVSEKIEYIEHIEVRQWVQDNVRL